ncbi:MAG TPA: anti-sigma factor antagonist [Planctomycetaceae bacterium]|nr:anti-sigma factor antagonist [Planctomycetaceae bacterium]
MSSPGPEEKLLLRWHEYNGVPVLTLMVPELRADPLIARLEQELERVLEQQKPGQLVLDLSHVHLMSSAGLRVLIWLRRKLAELGSRFNVAGAREHVREVFETTRLSREQFHLYPDVPAAVRALKGNAG